MKIYASGSTVRKIVLALTLTVFAAVILKLDPVYGADEVPELSPGIPNGYLLPFNRLPNSILLLPLPPGENSLRFALDLQISRSNLELMGTSRWDLAAQDADLTLPHSVNTFSCALDIAITEQDTPRLYMLLRRIAMDAVKSAYPAKLFYMRPRPFMVNQHPICTPDLEEALWEDGSYPSGHTAMAWACALALSEIVPEKRQALLSRAQAFGQSRVVCNVHWQSDVNAGRTMGAATFAALQTIPQFLEDLEAAKAEIQAARDRGLKPTRDCRWEAAVLN